MLDYGRVDEQEGGQCADASSPEIIYLKMTASCKICISVVQSEL